MGRSPLSHRFTFGNVVALLLLQESVFFIFEHIDDDHFTTREGVWEN